MEQGAQSIYRTIAVLKAIADRNREGAGMSELATATDLTGPTVHRILRALTDLGMVLQLENRRYCLGPLAYDLGLTASTRFDLQNLTREVTDRLAEHTGDTVFFSRLSGKDMVCVTRTSGSFPVKTLITDVGLRRPLGAGASGLAVLSVLPHSEAEAIIEMHASVYMDQGRRPEQVRREVEAARRLGYVARDIPLLGARTLSMPLRDPSGRPFGSISISSISQRMAGEHEKLCLDLLRSAVSEIETKVKVRYSAHG